VTGLVVTILLATAVVAVVVLLNGRRGGAQAAGPRPAPDPGPTTAEVSARLQQGLRRMAELRDDRAAADGPGRRAVVEAEMDQVIAGTRADLDALPATHERLRRMTRLALDEMREIRDQP
jgi:hypothetical protein